MPQSVWSNMFEGGSLWAGVISGGYSQLQDTISLSSGKIAKNDYAVSSTRNVSGALGTMAGVEYGAILGTMLMPGVGTTIGSVVGGLIGDRFGRFVGTQAGSALFQNSNTGSSPVAPRENALDVM